MRKRRQICRSLSSMGRMGIYHSFFCIVSGVGPGRTKAPWPVHSVTSHHSITFPPAIQCKIFSINKFLAIGIPPRKGRRPRGHSILLVTRARICAYFTGGLSQLIIKLVRRVRVFGLPRGSRRAVEKWGILMFSGSRIPSSAVGGKDRIEALGQALEAADAVIIGA